MKKITIALMILTLFFFSNTLNLKTQTNKLLKSKILIEEWTGTKKSKFSSYAFQKEGIIIKSAGANSFTYKHGNQYSGIIAETYLKKNTIKELCNFIKQGGRAILFVCMEDARYNGDFQEYFSISIIREWSLMQIPATEENEGKRIKIKGEDFCLLFRGLILASGAVEPVQWRNNKPIHWVSSGIRSYLVVDNSVDWVLRGINIKEEKRFLSAWRKLGKGEVLFLVSFDRGYSTPKSFICDNEIESEQNLEASMRLAKWVAGKTEHPKK